MRETGGPALRIVQAEPAENALLALADEWQRVNRITASAKEVRRNRRVIERFIEAAGVESPDELTPGAIERYIADMLAGGASAKTVRNHAGSIGSFARWVKQKTGEGQVFFRLRLPPLEELIPHYLNPREVRAVLFLARRYGVYCEVCLALNTGLRVGELRMLAWRDVSLPDRYLLVRRSKGRRPRQVWLNALALAVLREQYETYSSYNWVFPGGVARRGQGYVWDQDRPRGYDWWVATALKPIIARIPSLRALPKGTTGRGWHTFRHTFASRLIQAGVSPYKVSAWLGHKNLETTRRYTHLSPEFDQDIERII